jgi:ABC-type nitrate/sulfonate/bicarbonate transport system permease component
MTLGDRWSTEVRRHRPGDRPGFFGGAALALLLLASEAVARLGWVSALFLPVPTAVFAEAIRMAQSGEPCRHIGISLVRVGIDSTRVISGSPGSSWWASPSCRFWGS